MGAGLGAPAVPPCFGLRLVRARSRQPCRAAFVSRARAQSAGAESGSDASAASSGERDTPGACAAAADTASASGGWTEDQLAQAYGLTGLYDEGGLGDGQTIGVLELEPFLRSDIDAFDDCFFGPGHTTVIHTIPVDGFDLQGAGTGESALDLEMLAALAPGARLDVYEAPNTSFGSIDGYNAMVSADQVNIVSTSWGACETSLQVSAPGTQQIENYIFEEAAAEGQTVFASSGDTGSDDCAGTQFSSTKPERPYLSVDDPASQPYVVGVGGTSLRSDTPPLLPHGRAGMERRALRRRDGRRIVEFLGEPRVAGAVRRPGHDGRDKAHGSRREFGRGRKPRAHLL